MEKSWRSEKKPGAAPWTEGVTLETLAKECNYTSSQFSEFFATQ
jgi:hypothetical protein